MAYRLLLLVVSALGTGAIAAALDIPADADHDGRVSLPEFQASRGAMILKADLDGDGKVSSLEWARQAGRLKNAVATRGYPSMGGGSEPAVFPQVDTNGDGQLDRAEIDVATRARFAELDANHDGAVTGPEARELIAAARR